MTRVRMIPLEKQNLSSFSFLGKLVLEGVESDIIKGYRFKTLYLAGSPYLVKRQKHPSFLVFFFCFFLFVPSFQPIILLLFLLIFGRNL